MIYLETEERDACGKPSWSPLVTGSDFQLSNRKMMTNKKLEETLKFFFFFTWNHTNVFKVRSKRLKHWEVGRDGSGRELQKTFVFRVGVWKFAELFVNFTDQRFPGLMKTLDEAAQISKPFSLVDLKKNKRSRMEPQDLLLLCKLTEKLWKVLVCFRGFEVFILDKIKSHLIFLSSFRWSFLLHEIILEGIFCLSDLWTDSIYDCQNKRIYCHKSSVHFLNRMLEPIRCWTVLQTVTKSNTTAHT